MDIFEFRGEDRIEVEVEEKRRGSRRKGREERGKVGV